MRQRGYADVFDGRGASYHRAMAEQPEVRAAEFGALVKRARLEPSMLVLDVPAGGGYLAEYLPEGVRCVHVETSRAFFEAARAAGRKAVFTSELARLPFEDASVDRVLSLAGLHHEDERAAFYGEVSRVLRPGGELLIGEVQANSKVARFLDGFVDTHGEGHRGSYLGPKEHLLLEQAGLTVESSELVSVPWRARTEQALASFCRTLFALDRASMIQMQDGLREHLGVSTRGAFVELAWELLFISSRRG